MTRAPNPPNEDVRMAALRQARLLDTDAERSFDDVVKLAARICGTPISLVSLVDDERQWFKARVGLDATETSREVSFCAHAIHEPSELFIVPDATHDPRFADNPLVTGAPHIRFYAGAPLESPDGQPIGTLCVIDSKPRELSEEQLDSLRALGLLARDLIGLRVNINEIERLVDQVKTLSGLLPMCSWCRQVRDDQGYWSRVEDYLQSRSDARVSHGMCPDCMQKVLIDGDG